MLHWKPIVFWTLSIVQMKYKNIKSRHFGSWFLFRLQVKGGETPTQMGPLDRANLSHWTLDNRPVIAIISVKKDPSGYVSPFPSPEDGRRTSFRNVVILYFYISSGRWTKSRRQLVLNVIHHRQNLLEFTFCMFRLIKAIIRHSLIKIFQKRSAYNIKLFGTSNWDISYTMC
jgi:hypothetical protein